MSVSYEDFQPPFSSRRREDIEWSISYAYHARDTEHPRVLLIGDSICNGYQNAVRLALEGFCNISFWASSRCVTDPMYFRELSFQLDLLPYTMICFNNGLHSLTTDRREWAEAYRAAVAFLEARLPTAKLFLTLSTPMQDAEKTAVCEELNAVVRSIAAEQSLSCIDLFAPMAARPQDSTYTDGVHFQKEAVEEQVRILTETIRTALGNIPCPEILHAETKTGPSGAL